MAVWQSEQGCQVKTASGPKLNVKTYMDEQVTDSSGQASFDISGLDAKEIIFYDSEVVGLTGVTGTEKVSESLSEIVVSGKKENSVTVVLGAVLTPFISVGSGVTIRLVLNYR